MNGSIKSEIGTDYIIVCCQKCGQKNRVITHKSTQRPICGRCRIPLGVSNIYQNNKLNSFAPAGRPLYLVKVAAVICIVIAIITGAAWFVNRKSFQERTENIDVEITHHGQNTDHGPRNVPASQTISTSAEEISSATPATSGRDIIKPKHNVTNTPTKPPSALLPQTGEVTFNGFKKNQFVAPLELIASGESHFLVKMTSIADFNKFVYIFIRKGEVAKIKMPLGDFTLKFASGDNWHGYEHKFYTGQYSAKALTPFSFTKSNDGWYGHTITLYGVINGNLPTEQIGNDEF